jgi:hypothetical protein
MRRTTAAAQASHLVVSRRRHGQPPFASMVARLRAPSLDQQLALGVEPWRSSIHAARARQLTSDRARRKLGRSLERLIEEAEAPPQRRFGVAVPLAREGVREARPLLLTLASRLRDNAPVAPRGVAALKDLLTNGAGPFYTDGYPETLGNRLQAIDFWLDVPD